MKSLNIKYIPELDQLRGVAVLLVLFFHAIASVRVAGQYLGVTEKAIPVADSIPKLFIVNGFTGVALFFVISGFLFTWGALQVETFNLKKFYFNRFLRIYPMFLVILMVVFALAYPNVSLGRMVQDLLGFGNFLPPLGDFDVVLWTIAVELQFYMIFPFLFLLLKRQGVRYLLGLIAILVMLRLLIRLEHLNLHEPVYWTLLGRLDQFLVGMALAWLIYRLGWLSSAPRRLHSGLLVAGILATIALMTVLLWAYTTLGWKYGESYLQVIWPLIDGLMWAAFGVFYVGLARRLQPWLLRPIQFIGMISYSIYLLHYPIIRAIQDSHLALTIPGHHFASGVLYTVVEVIPLSVVASVLTFYVIEKPVLDLRKRYTSARTDQEPQPVPAP